MTAREIYVGAGAIVLVIVGLTLHEWAHAAVANLRGDDTAKREGRLTLNPLVHMHPLLTVVMPIVGYFVLPLLAPVAPVVFGGARPVPIVPSNLKYPWVDLALASAAGPAVNLLLAGLLLVVDEVYRSSTGHSAESILSEALRLGAFFNLLLFLFNLIPIPPLDGSRIIAPVIPGPLRGPYLALAPVGIVAVFVLMLAVPSAGNWIFQTTSDLYDEVEGHVRQLLRAVGVPLVKGR
ncbi:MAG: site-2 protease family protein [Planctomycetota bacterium]